MANKMTLTVTFHVRYSHPDPAEMPYEWPAKGLSNIQAAQAIARSVYQINPARTVWIERSDGHRAPVAYDVVRQRATPEWKAQKGLIITTPV